MKNLLLPEINKHRDRSPALIAYYGSAGDGTCGAFFVPLPKDRAPIRVIASSDLGWDHISVSRKNRCPNWDEMEFIKRLFFKPDEVVMQLHVATDQHISDHHIFPEKHWPSGR